ncbi:GvpL/GvpF family gas vesicle protein [Streptomyces sp. NBC_00525]|uniref:GvpL/GvpF family gas vesicle protein n=1 Tax=Streptomyces sp. NBC_00525 TaxID=2903660 RepID=UPI002E81C141|nr:GvpL/GvpF family gas vesicle protein [Streptomyces sp. NBC_00525]WUC93450.1 GvpL/GvpF family gas vesicle protein [Streptomyces sp. NBC_00525]
MNTRTDPPGGLPAPDDGQLTYVYAVGRERPAPHDPASRPAGVDGGPLYPVTAGGLCALVSRVPAETFGTSGLTAQLEDLERLEALARVHHAVVDAAFAEAPVLPMRLATVYLDDAGVAGTLLRRREEFDDLLGRLEGHVELGLKVYADPRTADAPAPDPAATTTGAGAGRAYLRQRQASRRSGRDAHRAASDLVDRAARLTRDIAAARVVHRPQQGRLAARPGVNVANEAYLVPRSRAGELRRALTGLADGVAGVAVEVTGPWAPYSFATAPSAQEGDGGEGR